MKKQSFQNVFDLDEPTVKIIKSFQYYSGENYISFNPFINSFFAISDRFCISFPHNKTTAQFSEQGYSVYDITNGKPIKNDYLHLHRVEKTSFRFKNFPYELVKIPIDMKVFKSLSKLDTKQYYRHFFADKLLYFSLPKDEFKKILNTFRLLQKDKQMYLYFAKKEMFPSDKLVVYFTPYSYDVSQFTDFSKDVCISFLLSPMSEYLEQLLREGRHFSEDKMFDLLTNAYPKTPELFKYQDLYYSVNVKKYVVDFENSDDTYKAIDYYKELIVPNLDISLMSDELKEQHELVLQIAQYFDSVFLPTSMKGFLNTYFKKLNKQPKIFSQKTKELTQSKQVFTDGVRLKNELLRIL